MSMRAVLDAAYAQRARAADETDRLAVMMIAAGGGDVGKYEHVRVQLDRDLGLVEETGPLPGLVLVKEHKSLADFAASMGVA